MPVRVDRYEAHGEIRGGRLIVSRERMAAAVRAMSDGPVTVTVQRKKATRSLAQNAYLWAVCYERISEHTGYTPEEVHEWAKQEFLPKRVVFADGNGVLVGERVIGGSTAALNVNDMHDYIERLRQFAAERLSVVIEDPDPDYARAL